jgi:uncharacterized protein YmfQ (DUF2313 family)
MTSQVYQTQDWINSFLGELPQGRLWDKSLDSPLYQVVASLMPNIAALSDDATNLIVDAFPATTVDLLPEWQATLGMPDACSIGQNLTLLQAQQQVLARFIGAGGQSVPFLIAYALALGYAITITEYSTFKAGTGKAGGIITSAGIAFSWLVTLPAQQILYFLAGSSTAGQKLETVENQIIQCELQRICPAHTNLFFQLT